VSLAFFGWGRESAILPLDNVTLPPTWGNGLRSEAVMIGEVKVPITDILSCAFVELLSKSEKLYI
jgi:hypothetical protein